MLTEEAIANAIKLERDYILDPDNIDACIYMVDEYAFIQDKSSTSGISNVKLWEAQKKVIRSIHENKLNIILKARQLGITWTMLFYAVWSMLAIAGYTVIGLSKDDTDAMELVRRIDFILDKLPNWIVMDKKKAPIGYEGLTYFATKHRIEIYRFDGEMSVFEGKPASQGAGRSLTASLVLQDEWAFQMWARTIWSASYPTMNRVDSGKFVGLSTAKRGTLFEDIWKNPEGFGFNDIFLPWQADPRRTQEWYEASKKALSKNKEYMREYPETPEEAFSGGDRQAFPEFSRDIHVMSRDNVQIPEHWYTWSSLDNGYSDPFAFYKYSVSEDGIVYVYGEVSREETDDKIGYKRQAEKMMDTCRKDDGSYQKIACCVAGVDAWNTNHRDVRGKQLLDYYREGGFKYGFVKAVTDRKFGKGTVHHYLEPYWDENVPNPYIANEMGTWASKLIILDDCPLLIESLGSVLTEEKNDEVVEDSSIDHWYDSLRYGLNYYHKRKSGTANDDEENDIIKSHKNKVAKRRTTRRKRVAS